ncbi:MAG: ABC transporter substrate-binding protein [Thiofilum sp.]|uniref:ABC transporter substrate-binding protein n=1 Tax=Thiofilum sp. TaxID=2212733 RepID=UPI0025E2EFD4|nr:ABC transporter substrate-binding protein [Thiofilum sp.]MBK8452099.1 hypothetical protein [Thiofilum sp.]
MNKRYNCRWSKLSLTLFLTLICSIIIKNAGAESQSEQPFVIAYSSMPTTLDPHKSHLAVNIALALHRFDSLFNINFEGGADSYLVEKWENLNSKVWLFELKKDIKFHDGSLLTTRDVIYSLDRIKAMPDSYFNRFVQRLEHYQPLDPYRFKIITKEPNANLLHDLGFIFIIKAQSKPLLDEFFSSKLSNIGTGPYLLESYTSEDNIHLRVNPYYHSAPVWVKSVCIKGMPDPTARLIALQQGKVQLAEGLTEVDSTNILTNHDISFIRSPTHRLLYLTLDTTREITPFVRSIDGNVLNNNPLKSLKVRKAISLGIDRKYLVSTILKYTGTPADQYVLPNVLGYIGGLIPDAYDPDEAIKLLSEAGYPNGFQLTLHGAHNRYLKDKAVIEAIAQMLTKIRIKTTPVVLDEAGAFLNKNNYEYSATLIGGSSEGSLQLMLENLVHSCSEERGIFNIGHHSNRTIDELIKQGGAQFNQVKRMRHLKQAQEMAMQDHAFIPLYFENAVWGIKYHHKLDFSPTRSGLTLAQDIRPLGVK